MSDIALHWNAELGAADLSVLSNDLAREDGLQTAVLLSLFTNARHGDEAGWWGDSVPVVDGDRTGSKLWRHARAKSSAATLADIEQDAHEALQWMVDDRVADRIEATATVPRPGHLELVIAIHRPDQADAVRYRFAAVWRAQET